MYRVIDIFLIIVLLIGMLFYHSTLYGRNERKKELSYIVIVYLLEAPYRGFVARNMPYTDLLIDVIVLAYFLTMCIKRKIRLCKNYMIWLVGFLTATILYVISSSGVLGIFKVQEAKFYIGICLLVTIISTEIRSKEGIKQIINTFIVNSIVMSTADLISFLIYRNCMFCSMISNRNFISIYNFIGLLGLLYIYKFDKRLRIKMAIGLVFIVLILMKSSSVYLAILILGVIWGMRKLYLTSSFMYKLVIVFCIVGVIGTIVVVSSPHALQNTAVMAIQKVRDSNDYTRTLIWEEAIDLAKENWVYGIGPDQFRDSRTGYSFPTHNDYLKVLVETGIIGLVAFVIFLMKTCREMLLIQDNNVKQSCFCAILALMVFILFHGYINYVTFWVVMCVPYWWVYMVENKVRKI